MQNEFYSNIYNPDVLSCLANLSSDEVFTPPEIVNEVLDMLPKSIWLDKNATFLDPGCKSGVFLREIAKRLIVGLEKEIPNYQERLDNIYQRQLFGIAITEITSLMSRRSLYCSKYPNGKYSISSFDNAEGNIRYNNKLHTWENGSCIHCGATERLYKQRMGLESHAYEFIHETHIERILNMKFDVIIGNPPYQLNDSGNGASAKPIYNLFIEQAKKLKPRFLTMIVPARWYAGGKGLDGFRDSMLNDKRIRIIHDYVDAKECFPSVKVKGGICYFLWNRDNPGLCEVNNHRGSQIYSKLERPLLEAGYNTFIRYNFAIDIVRKIQKQMRTTFDSIVSTRQPFGLPTNFNEYSPLQIGDKSIRILANKSKGYVSRSQVLRNKDWIDQWKVYIPEAIGVGDLRRDVLKPLLGEPNTICSETYIVVGPVASKEMADNIISYMDTKFFHFLLGLIKITQHTTSKTYSGIPLLNFEKPWTDQLLYAKYNLSDNEVKIIETSVWSDVHGLSEDEVDE